MLNLIFLVKKKKLLYIFLVGKKGWGNFKKVTKKEKYFGNSLVDVFGLIYFYFLGGGGGVFGEEKLPVQFKRNLFGIFSFCMAFGLAIA